MNNFFIGLFDFKRKVMKTIVITGATSGIGKSTAQQLSELGYRVVMLVRNIEKGKSVKLNDENAGSISEIIYCDLENLETVKEAAEKLAEKYDSIDVLINNDGGLFQNKYETVDGLERSFQVNHLGHFYLTNELIPLLASNGGGRIVNVSSEMHKYAKPDFRNLQMLDNYSGARQYGNVKLYNIYFTQELAERFSDKGIIANAVHPGGVNTNFDRDMKGFFKFG